VSSGFVSAEGIGNVMDSVMHPTVSRREFLRYAGLAGVTIAFGGGLGGLLAACGGSATTTTTGATTATTTPVSSETTGAPGLATTESHPGTNPNQKIAYLTFDDGPSRLTPELLSALETNHVTATFFVIGLHAEQFPGMLKKIVSYGNVIGVHSWTHDYSYIYKNTRNFLADFKRIKDYIYQETGITPKICRLPGGTNNTVCFHYSKGHIMREIVALVKGSGFKYYDWNVSSAEASSPPPSTNTIIKTVVSQCKNKDTAVILFHDTDIQGYLDAIPGVIAKLREMGFTFETLSPDNPPKSRSASVQFKPS
jgi:peptidoglycan-N-acetylglucosamine deacetylase